ncbi:MAG TPA: hypothetical protein VI643_02370 [Planctomycetota bacterium]|nr:hypothetical protein [Planctomycetota bacterium]
MPNKQTLKIPLGLEPLRRGGLTAYTAIRKILHQLDRLAKEGADGPRAFAAARALDELERAASDASLVAFEKELKDWIKTTRERIHSGQEEFKDWFAAELERLLADQYGLTLRGRFPLFIASHYRMKLDLDHDSVAICYGGDEDLLEKTKADPRAVASKINVLQRELEATLLPDDRFLMRFAESYDRAVKQGDLAPSDQAPILDVLREFVWSIQSKKFQADPRRENFTTYSRVNLSYQLFKLVNRRFGHRTFELIPATSEQAARKESHLWVPTNDAGDGTSHAFVAFR